MRITRKKPSSRHLTIGIGVLTLAVVVVLAVWVVQIAQLFQPSSIGEMGQDVASTREQIDAGMNLAKELREGEATEESLPEFLQETRSMVEDALREQAALDAVAQEMIEDMHKKQTDEESTVEEKEE